MLKVWSATVSCDVAVETLVSRSSSSSRELELPNAFLSLNDSRSCYICFKIGEHVFVEADSSDCG